MVKAGLPLPSWNCFCSHLETTRSYQPWGFPAWPNFVSAYRQDQWPCIDTDLPGKGWGDDQANFLLPPLSDSVTSPWVLPQVPAEDVGPVKSTGKATSALRISVLIWQVNSVSLPWFTSCKAEVQKCLPACVVLDIQVMKLVQVLNKGFK